MIRVNNNYIYHLLISLILLLTLGSCHEEPEAPKSCRSTLLVYMEARNDLSSNAVKDLYEMMAAEIPADCRLLVYCSTYDPQPVLFEIKNGNKNQLKSWPEDSSAVDPKQMDEVIAEARRQAPSDEFGIVFWSHSSGWKQTMNKARAFGLENNYRQMSITDLAEALTGKDIDYMIFDTCYMGCVEVAYELRLCADWMVASVCEVPLNGMPYDKVLPQLFDETESLPVRLSRVIDTTVDSYLPGTTGCPSTMSLIDLSRMDALAEAVKNAPGQLPDDYEPQVFSRNTPYKYMFCDFGQYFEAIGGNPAVLAQTVVHERHTPKIWGTIPLTHCSGLSVYLPQLFPGYDYSSFEYSSLSWAKYLNLTDFSNSSI